MAEKVKLRVTLDFGHCSNCGRGTDYTPAMLEAHTRLCLPYCFSLWYFTHKKFEEELGKTLRAFVQRQAVLPWLDWLRFNLKRTVRRS